MDEKQTINDNILIIKHENKIIPNDKNEPEDNKIKIIKRFILIKRL